ncbi:MAG: hypothetical protein RMK29_16060 [Myxococcales bacterium]|nr:hypothetical protein [Myxococcota bacterium]MDW8283232.1 hypothetical protein [Myxococcales bacterium]
MREVDSVRRGDSIVGGGDLLGLSSELKIVCKPAACVDPAKKEIVATRFFAILADCLIKRRGP